MLTITEWAALLAVVGALLRVGAGGDHALPLVLGGGVTMPPRGAVMGDTAHLEIRCPHCGRLVSDVDYVAHTGVCEPCRGPEAPRAGEVTPMLTPAQLGTAMRDLAEFTWVCLDSRDDAIQVAHAAAVPVEISLSPAGWRVAERLEPARPT